MRSAFVRKANKERLIRSVCGTSNQIAHASINFSFGQLSPNRNSSLVVEHRRYLRIPLDSTMVSKTDVSQPMAYVFELVIEERAPLANATDVHEKL